MLEFFIKSFSVFTGRFLHSLASGVTYTCPNFPEHSTDLSAPSRQAEGLGGVEGLARLAQVCERWISSACLCFALSRQEQERSQFRYAYSSFQIEYSRNLLFKSGDKLDEVYQGLIDRTRRLLDVPRLKTIFGRKRRCRKTAGGNGRLEKNPGWLCSRSDGF